VSVPAKVLDSYALLAFFADEPGAAVVEELLLGAQSGKLTALMSVVNLGEVWYAVARTTSAELADAKLDQVRAMAIEIIDADWPLTVQAARYKARGRIAYADCFAAALAIARDADLVTGDREFEEIGAPLRVHWL